MVSPDIIYIKLLTKVNKGNSQGGIAVDKDRFVLLFNECKNRWVENILKEKDSILIDALWGIVETREFLNGVVKPTYVEFEVPEDFYEIALTNCEAQKGECKKTLFLREVKNQDKNQLHFNNNYKPDFDFDWSFVSLQGKGIRVYKNDFKVKKLTLEYYKVIPSIDIEGYLHLDGNPSSNIGIGLSEQYVDQIINVTAEEFMRDFQDQQNLVIAKDRTKSQE